MNKRLPQISTASLPDIVFLLLFFFMVSSVMRSTEEKVRLKEPEASETTTVDKKILIKELSIGFDNSKAESQKVQIHDGERFLQLSDIVHWAHTSRNELPEHLKEQMIVMIKADENVEMGIVSDVGEQLRKADARKVLYRTLPSTSKYSD